MKYLILIFFILQSFTSSAQIANNKKVGGSITKINNSAQRYTLTGFINKNIPVELNISISNNVILGNIRYLNTKAKTSIKIIGNITDKNSYTLHEFQKDGNVTGSIYGTLKNNKLEGDWNATKSTTSYSVMLNVKSSSNSKPEVFSPISSNQLAGKYYYQYGEKGYQGSITIKKLSGNTYAYDIGSVTHDPGRNIADASGKAVIKNNQLVIKVNNSCEFKVKFYNEFLTITKATLYQLSDCEFGHNATLEGTYLKVK